MPRSPAHAQAPQIPNHETLRFIGSGAYGEIWMARSVTGALRAVKVVSRENFENERSFNREFEGMSRFEPISRAHDGFVDILDVGRGGDGSFFYYVMELADDQAGGSELDVERYIPRTLATELARHKALPVADCVGIGLALCEALTALHERGLTHRDIKLSNIIFIGGHPKIADIGLVALAGQRSFVGTEGYVPPEGPGTVSADIYSLGKVLYEIATGKDRLDFPELQTALGEHAARPSFLQLNAIVLRACANDPSRRYKTAVEMRADLVRVADGAKVGRKSRALFWWALLLAILAVIGLLFFFVKKEPKLMPHDDVNVRHLEATVTPIPIPVATATPPPVSVDATEVNSDPPGAEIFIEGKSRGLTPLRVELAPGTYEVEARLLEWPAQTQRLVLEKTGEARLGFAFGNGSVKITSAPGGASVYAGGKEIGRTPLMIEEVPPGAVAYELRLAGFKPAAVRGVVEPRQQTFLPTRFEERRGPIIGTPWTNSLKMQFVPIGDLLFSIFETRVGDYEAFCSATGRARSQPDFEQGSNHPVVKVNREDAVAFCEWLTAKERGEDLLDESEMYRLPTDVEWSTAAGLPIEGGMTPEERDGKIKNEFPWGHQWPPPAGAGNFADQSARALGKTIDGYNDGFFGTAPVGSFRPNAAGLYDMAGNVWEWCAEGYKGSGKYKDWGVLRGGSWANANRTELQSSYRNVVDRNERDVIYGFRCVLVPTK